MTDGAPRDLRDAHANGFETRNEYAQARRRELLSALAIAGIGEERTVQLGVVDQEASLDLAGLAERVAAVLDECTPDMVMTHPYEGGHPDHDAVAFAVHAAVRLIKRPVDLVEFTSYHSGGSGLTVGEFLPNGGPISVMPLTEEVRRRKRRMLDCFATQRETLRPFRVNTERFRPAPQYYFTRPPHPPPLYYDGFPFGIRSSDWLARAAGALRRLDRRRAGRVTFASARRGSGA